MFATYEAEYKVWNRLLERKKYLLMFYKGTSIARSYFCGKDVSWNLKWWLLMQVSNITKSSRWITSLIFLWSNCLFFVHLSIHCEIFFDKFFPSFQLRWYVNYLIVILILDISHPGNCKIEYVALIAFKTFLIAYFQISTDTVIPFLVN